MFHSEAFDAGFEAFLQGLPQSDNPHDVDGWDGVNHELWQNGWESAEYEADQYRPMERRRNRTMYEYNFQENTASGWETLMQYGSMEEVKGILPDWCKEFFDEHGFWPVYGRHYKVTYDVPSRHVFAGLDLPQDTDQEARAW